MNVGVLLLTQETIGSALLRAAQAVYEPLPLNVTVLAVNAEASVDVFVNIVRQRVRALDTGNGVIVLLDAPGSVPCQLAQSLNYEGKIRLVTGLNLPMLLGLFKNPQRGLDDLANAVLQAGRQGIVDAARGPHGQTTTHAH